MNKKYSWAYWKIKKMSFLECLLRGGIFYQI